MPLMTGICCIYFISQSDIHAMGYFVWLNSLENNFVDSELQTSHTVEIFFWQFKTIGLRNHIICYWAPKYDNIITTWPP